MGACGCSDGIGVAKFPGPNGSVYTIDFHDGCRYCDTPAGIDIRRFSAADAREWGVNELPDAPMFSYRAGKRDPGDDSAMMGCPVVHPRLLVRALDKHAGTDLDGLDAEVREAVEDAARSSRREWLGVALVASAADGRRGDNSSTEGK